MSANSSVTMQVIGAGIGRTGTTSLSEALAILGIGPTYDWVAIEKSSDEAINIWVKQLGLKKSKLYGEENGIFTKAHQWDPIFRGYAAIVDAPGNLFAIDLAKAYPEAKVILTVRDSPEAWLNSWEKTILYQQRTWNESWVMRIMSVYDDWTGSARQPRTNRVMTALSGGKLEYVEPRIQWYHSYKENAYGHIDADRLLEYNVKQGWEPLCRFLGKEIPDVPFPHVKDASAYNATIFEAIQIEQQRLQLLVIATLFALSLPTILIVAPWTTILGSASQSATIS